MLSIDIGCVRLFERHLASDPPAPEEVAALRRDVREHLGKVPEVLDPSSARRVVGVAGTVTTVTAIALDLEVYDPERIHHATIDAGRIGQTAERLAAMTIAERAALPVMAKGREDVIAAGALVLDEICRTFGFGRMIASETDILDGVLLGLARRRSPAGRSFPDQPCRCPVAPRRPPIGGSPRAGGCGPPSCPARSWRRRSRRSLGCRHAREPRRSPGRHARDRWS